MFSQEEDDIGIDNVEVSSLMTAGSGDVVHFNELSIAVETFESELNKLQKSGFLLIDGTPVQELPNSMKSKRLSQVS